MFAETPNVERICRVIWKDLWLRVDYYRHLSYRGGCTISLFKLSVLCEKCVAARQYAFIWKQLLISNDRNKVRWVVLGLSQDGTCTDLFENLSENSLKGQCHEIFCFWFFWWISFPPAPEYCIRTVSNIFEKSRRYSQVKVHHQYQRDRRQNCCRYQRHRRQIFPPISLVLLIPVANLPPVSMIPAANLPPVSTTPAANLPPVSMTPVANNGYNIRLQSS